MYFRTRWQLFKQDGCQRKRGGASTFVSMLKNTEGFMKLAKPTKTLPWHFVVKLHVHVQYVFLQDVK